MRAELKHAAVKIVLCRAAGVALAAALFYCVGWLPLREAVRDGVAWVMRQAGFLTAVTVYEGSPALMVGGRQFYFTPDCTYVDLWLLLIPFLWKLNWPWRRNLYRVLSFGLMVGVVNFIRVCMSTYLYTTGQSWLVAHDLLDYLLYYPTLLLVATTALRRDSARQATGPGSGGAPAEAQRTPC